LRRSNKDKTKEERNNLQKLKNNEKAGNKTPAKFSIYKSSDKPKLASPKR